VSDRIELPLAGTPFGASPSFIDLVRRERPEALPSASTEAPFPVPHGTTVLGLKFAGGIVMAGDRRATAGNMIADAKVRKVFAADDYSAIAIAVRRRSSSTCSSWSSSTTRRSPATVSRWKARPTGSRR
jgi:Proteasome subunit